MKVQPPQTHNHGNYDDNVRFDDDNKIGYKYILAIIKLE